MAGTLALSRLRFDRFELQLDERRLLADGHAAPLRGHAFSLLAVLVERPGHLISKAELLQRVWGKVIVEENALQAHISALRKVLGAAAIATVPGQGYRFALEVQPVPVPTEHVPVPAHNLPQPLTSFIGREREIEAIRERLPSSRLLTLTGAGGIGKTRLALQVAGASLDRFPGGVWFVELAPLNDPSLLIQAVAQALAVEAKPGQAIDEVVLDWLRPRRMLLVLDNAEHLLETCARLVERLLKHCAGLTVLATSRERLGVDGEGTYRVPSLSLPAGGADEDLLDCEAARLLIDRARLLRPDFGVKGSEVGTLASVCRRLDGIALAIELAAAQLRMMSLESLSGRLDDRFRILTSGARTALPRQQTLRALIDWSHELLSDPERSLLRRVSVFAGGWTLEAAERVCAGDGVDSEQIWDLLSSLTDKSLVISDTGGEEPRFDMLETVRHYAKDRLVEAGERETMRERHLRYFVDMAGDLTSTRTDPEVQQTMRRLEAEHDNVRAALAWCEAEPIRRLDGLRLAGQLTWFWGFCGHIVEGRSWLGRLLAKVPTGERGEVLAAALHASGVLAVHDHDAAAAVEHLQEAILLWRELSNRRQLARSVGALADLEERFGNFPAARAHYSDVLSIAGGLGDERSVANALIGLSTVEFACGDYAAAEALLLQALPAARAVGPWVEGMVYLRLGRVLHAREDLQSAKSTLLDAQEKLLEFGLPLLAAWTDLELAEVYQDLEELPDARAHMQRVLRHTPEVMTDKLGWLLACAGLISDLAEPHCAALLWGCFQRHDEPTPNPALGWARLRQRRLQESARRALGDDAAFDKAWDEGRSWSLDEAYEYARSLI
jgi:non-specific serine/threonine protein kinase